MDVSQRGELKDDRLGAAGQAGQRRGQHEGNQLVLVRLVTEGNRPWLVLSDCLEHLAKRGMNDPTNQKETEQENPQYRVVENHRIVEIQNEKQAPARHRLDAVLASGEF